MPKRFRYPRNEAARRDKVAIHEIINHATRNIKSRNDAIAQAPFAGLGVSAALTGTAIANGVLEAAIVIGSETIIITLTGARWHANIGADNPITDALIAGITGDDGGSNGWGDEVAILFGTVVRTSDTVVTVTLPAAAAYNVVTDETITVDIPPLCLEKGGDPSGVTFDISIITLVITGTMVAGGVTEAEMVTGGETMILTLTGDTWHADIGSDNAQTTALLAAITGDDDYSTLLFFRIAQPLQAFSAYKNPKHRFLPSQEPSPDIPS